MPIVKGDQEQRSSSESLSHNIYKQQDCYIRGRMDADSDDEGNAWMKNENDDDEEEEHEHQDFE